MEEFDESETPLEETEKENLDTESEVRELGEEGWDDETGNEEEEQEWDKEGGTDTAGFVVLKYLSHNDKINHTAQNSRSTGHKP